MKIAQLINYVDIFYKLASEMGDSDIELSDLKKNQLSVIENEQLGKLVPNSQFSYIDPEKWTTMRDYLVANSLKSNPKLNKELTAYTPGETLKLLNHPKIKEWFNKMRNFRIPDNYKVIVLVPCAKTKPWGFTRPKRSNLYNAYNNILEMAKEGKLSINGDIYFVTISEPLGVVPQDFWDEFPQYDNPGLFKDPVMRSGLFTRDYPNTPLGKKQIIPFDEGAYSTAIKTLGVEIGTFINNNNKPGRVFVSFVDDHSGKIKTTHSEMLDHANIEEVIPNENRFTKPPGRTSRDKTKPIDHLLNHLSVLKF